MKNLKVQSTENLSHLNFIQDYLVNKTTQHIDEEKSKYSKLIDNKTTKINQNQGGD